MNLVTITSQNNESVQILRDLLYVQSSVFRNASMCTGESSNTINLPFSVQKNDLQLFVDVITPPCIFDVEDDSEEIIRKIADFLDIQWILIRPTSQEKMTTEHLMEKIMKTIDNNSKWVDDYAATLFQLHAGKYVLWNKNKKCWMQKTRNDKTWQIMQYGGGKTTDSEMAVNIAKVLINLYQKVNKNQKASRESTKEARKARCSIAIENLFRNNSDCFSIRMPFDNSKEEVYWSKYDMEKIERKILNRQKGIMTKCKALLCRETDL